MTGRVAAVVAACLLRLLLGAARAGGVQLASVDAKGAFAPLPATLPSFEDFVRRYARTYAAGSEEYARRKVLFQVHVERVLRHNSSPRRTWTAGVTHLADRTPEELRSLRGLKGPTVQAQPTRRLGLSTKVREIWSTEKITEREAHEGFPDHSPYNVSGLPADFSWRGRLQAMSHITDQGNCGACWAQAAVGVLRAHSELYNSDRTFSAQEVISCARNTHKCGGPGGCDGSPPQLAFDYLGQRGLHTEEEWPYADQQGMCDVPKGSSKAFTLASPKQEAYVWGGAAMLAAVDYMQYSGRGHEVGYTGYRRLALNRADALMRAVYEIGPAAVIIYADIAWNMYSEGIMDACSNVDDNQWVLDHAVVVAGYGVDHGGGEHVPYWLLQNSWGSYYGEGGFIRIRRGGSAREESESCGLNIAPELADWCDNWPWAEVAVCGACGMLYNAVVPLFELSPKGLLYRQPDIRTIEPNSTEEIP